MKHDKKESKGNTFILMFKENVLGVSPLQNNNYLVTESLNVQFKMKRMAIKILKMFTTIMMKIMMK